MLQKDSISLILELSDFEYNKSLEINAKANPELLILIWQILSKGLLEIKDSSNYLQHLNLIFFKILHLNNLFDVDKLMNSVDENISLPKEILQPNIVNPKPPTSKTNNNIDEINKKVLEVFKDAKFIKEE